MATKTDPITHLREFTTQSLSEIFSLKTTCEKQEETIQDLNRRNTKLVLDLEARNNEVVRLQSELAAKAEAVRARDKTIEQMTEESDHMRAELANLQQQADTAKSPEEGKKKAKKDTSL